MRMWEYTKTKQKKLIDELKIVAGTKADYEKLKKFHYINTANPSGKLCVFSLKHKNTLYGVIVYSPPILEIVARNRTHIGKAMNKAYLDRSDRYKFLNKNFTNVSRVIIHPSIRGIGSASYLIENTWREVKTRFVECNSAMLYYRNFFPKSYSYYTKVERQLDEREFFIGRHLKRNTLGNGGRGASVRRIATPVQRYGYVLYINEDMKIKY